MKPPLLVLLSEEVSCWLKIRHLEQDTINSATASIIKKVDAKNIQGAYTLACQPQDWETVSMIGNSA